MRVARLPMRHQRLERLLQRARLVQLRTRRADTRLAAGRAQAARERRAARPARGGRRGARGGGAREHPKRGQFDKLTDLLDPSQMYTEFLGERITEIEEADKKNARAQHDERPPSRASCRRPAAARGCSRREGRRSTPPSEARRAASCVLRLLQCALVSSELQYKW